jgi:hypothetical protein
MSTVRLEEAGKRQLQEIVEKLPREKEIVITSGGRPVATLRAAPESSMAAGQHSIFDIKPHSVGGILRPYPHPDDDILGEMLEEKLDEVFPRLDQK